MGGTIKFANFDRIGIEIWWEDRWARDEMYVVYYVEVYEIDKEGKRQRGYYFKKCYGRYLESAKRAYRYQMKKILAYEYGPYNNEGVAK